jgi:hypothetical protein
MPGREPEEQVLHDHIVRLLHLEYYNYPSAKHPQLLTFVNHPTMAKALHGLDHQELFPDLIVTDANTDRVVTLVEVETESTVNALEAAEWLAFSRLGARLHLYVPRGFGPQALALCKDCAGTEIVQCWKEGKRYIIEHFADTPAAPTVEMPH